jgi:NADH-quinone oxidoreductase subunit I
VLLEFFKGFAVTFRHIFKPNVTVLYPEQKRVDAPIFRGKHKLNRYADGLERCVGCALCASVCPSEAIYLEAAENTQEHRVSPGERYAECYQIHLLRCIFCGFCEEACPENAIVLGPEYELAGTGREEFVLNKEDMLVKPEEGFGEYDVAAVTPEAHPPRRT